MTAAEATQSAERSQGSGYGSTRNLSFATSLERQSDFAAKNSPERGVFALLSAAARLLESKDYHRIRVDEVCQTADIARSTFYNHFRNKQALFVELFKQFNDFRSSYLEIDRNWRHPYQRILAICTQHTQLVLENLRIAQSYLELSSHVTEIAELWSAQAVRSARGFARTSAWETPKSVSNAQLDQAYLLLSLLTDNIYAIYVAERSSPPSGEVDTPEHLAEKIAVLIYQALHLESPPEEFLAFEQ